MDIDNDNQVNFHASTSSEQINPDQPSSSTNLTFPESNPVQDISLSASDQPPEIEILEQPSQDILEFEYIVTELL
jgi:hypothetical protein